MTKLRTIALSAGEPAGIGPDIIIQLAQTTHPCALVVFANRTLLEERAKLINLPITLIDWKEDQATPHTAGNLHIVDIPLKAKALPGKLDAQNSAYVIDCLDAAIDVCKENLADALVTAPVHKAIINDAGIPFSGHTEYLAARCNTEKSVMLFTTPTIHLALQTTHLPLKAVSEAITKSDLTQTLDILHDALKRLFKLPQPKIDVLGLNPHAGENGYLGSEEIDTIIPVIKDCQSKGYAVTGPLPADTAFINNTSDCVLAMYHDQALPLIKTHHFNDAVNVTLGLPIIRTSVDHGTALDLAGTPEVNANNICSALEMALKLTR